MCIGAIPLAVKAFGGSNKTAALSMLSPVAAIGSALSGKTKKPGISAVAATPATFGPSPSYGA